jgi:hypothetical protein
MRRVCPADRLRNGVLELRCRPRARTVLHGMIMELLFDQRAAPEPSKIDAYQRGLHPT